MSLSIKSFLSRLLGIAGLLALAACGHIELPAPSPSLAAVEPVQVEQVADIDSTAFIEQGIQLALAGQQRVYLYNNQSPPVLDCNFTSGPFLLLNGSFTVGPLCPPITFSRTSLATVFNSAGLLDYAPNNVLKQSNAFNTGEWAKTNATVSTGVSDPNGGNTAFTFTATSSNGIVYDNVSAPNSAKSGHAIWLRRRAGTGAVSIQTGTSTFVDVTSQISSSWTQIFVTGTTDSTGGNPAWLGVRLAINGDAVDAWCAQIEIHFATPSAPEPYIATTSAAYLGPRQDFNPATLANNGFLVEQASTNLARWSRDLTNAVYTKTNGTAALDQVGIDGVANSASSFLATAGNAKVLQAVTHASSTDNYAVWLKRLVGTGTVSVTVDGGSTYTDVTSQINSSTWSRVSINQAAVTNPSIGIKLTTNADKVAVDQSQLEVLGFKTSDIVTTNASMTRAVDVANTPLSVSASTSGMFFAKAIQTVSTSAGNPVEVGLDNGTTAIGAVFTGANNGGSTNSGTFLNISGTGFDDSSAFVAGTIRIGAMWTPSTYQAQLNGVNFAQRSLVIPGDLANVRIGSANASGNNSGQPNQTWFQRIVKFNMPSPSQFVSFGGGF